MPDRMAEDLSLVLSCVREYASLNNVPIISQEGADFLSELVRKSKPGRILEFGTAIGYSSLLMASRQPPAANLVTIEKNPERIKLAGHFFQAAGLQNQISLLAGDAREIAPLLTGSFDFVFIDAAKGQYLDYLYKVIDKLTPRAVIVADNVLFRGWVDGDVVIPRRFRTIVKRLREYLDFVRTDPRFRTEIFRFGDGLAVSYYSRNGVLKSDF